MINNEDFLKIKDDFKAFSLKCHPYLRSDMHLNHEAQFSMKKIEEYFLKLLGEHYVY
jgi:hypothetical protein